MPYILSLDCRENVKKSSELHKMSQGKHATRIHTRENCVYYGVQKITLIKCV